MDGFDIHIMLDDIFSLGYSSVQLISSRSYMEPEYMRSQACLYVLLAKRLMKYLLCNITETISLVYAGWRTDGLASKASRQQVALFKS